MTNTTSMLVLRLALVLFFGSFVLLRKAQTDFYNKNVAMIENEPIPIEDSFFAQRVKAMDQVRYVLYIALSVIDDLLKYCICSIVFPLRLTSTKLWVT
jgi:hypothetical protein